MAGSANALLLIAGIVALWLVTRQRKTQPGMVVTKEPTTTSLFQPAGGSVTVIWRLRNQMSKIGKFYVGINIVGTGIGIADSPLTEIAPGEEIDFATTVIVPAVIPVGERLMLSAIYDGTELGFLGPVIEQRSFVLTITGVAVTPSFTKRL